MNEHGVSQIEVDPGGQKLTDDGTGNMVTTNVASDTDGVKVHRKARKRGRSLRKAALLRPAAVVSASKQGTDEDSSGAGDASSIAHELMTRSVFSRGRTSTPHRDTVRWGWGILAITWFVFVTGMGSVLGVWSWALGKKDSVPDEVPMEEYYPALAILTAGVMSWLWVIAAWAGLKFFRHSAPAASSDF